MVDIDSIDEKHKLGMQAKKKSLKILQNIMLPQI